MATLSTLKPGVYTDYTIAPVFSPNQGKALGVIAVSPVQAQIHRLTSFSDAKRIFAPSGQTAENDHMMACLTAIYSISSPVVYALGVKSDTVSSYDTAVSQMFSTEISFLVLTSKQWNVQKDAWQQVLLLEKMLIMEPYTGADPLKSSHDFNCNRICVTSPKIYLKSGGTYNVAQAVLGAMLAKVTDPTRNLIGEPAGDQFFLPATLDSGKVESYLERGICVFEQNGNDVELIRGMTTSTKTADKKANDFTYRNVSMIFIQDTVLKALRETLKSALDSARNNQAGLNTILSLLVCRLDAFVEQGLLHNYDLPIVELDPDDPSRCSVTVGFRIMQGLSVIHLTAHISV